jgi:serine/threonine-protein kinase
VLAKGLRIGDYEILRHVINGAMSEVYEGRHAGRGCAVSIKVLHPDLCVERDMVARFLNEAQSLEALRHERLITVFAWGCLPEGRPFMVLEWLPHNLGQALARAGGAVVSEVAVRAAVQIAEAVVALHDRNILHRDLKPANILLAQEELASAEFKLADLSLAKVVRKEVSEGEPEPRAPLGVIHVSTGGNDLLGTPEYMAPEQWIRSKSVDDKADVYSLGVLLFQMIAGRLPFVAEQPKEWMGLHLLQSPPLDLLEGLAPAALRDLIAQMLGKKAAPRPSMRDVLEQLTAMSSISRRGPHGGGRAEG